MKNRSPKFNDPRLILPRMPEFAAARDCLVGVMKSPDSVPNGFDDAMASDTLRRAQRSASRMLEMASELGLIGVSVERVSSNAELVEGEIVLIEAEEES